MMRPAFPLFKHPPELQGVVKQHRLTLFPVSSLHPIQPLVRGK